LHLTGGLQMGDPEVTPEVTPNWSECDSGSEFAEVRARGDNKN